MNRIAEIRGTRGLTQKDLADLAGLSQPWVSRMERGQENVTLACYREVANALRVPLWHLFIDPAEIRELLATDLIEALSPDRQLEWIEKLQSQQSRR